MLCFVSLFSVTGCKKKEDDIASLSQNLTTYCINLELDTINKSVQANQTISYINNTNSILKNLKLHLYPQFFKKGATEYIISNTKLNKAYPNGLNFAEFEITRLKLNNIDTTISYEGILDSILTINLTENLLPNQTVEIYLEYSFKLPNL